MKNFSHKHRLHFLLIFEYDFACCEIDLRDFRPGDRLAASTSCATVSDMVTKLCF